MPRQPTMQDWIFLRNVNEPAYQGTAGWRADMPLSVYNNPLATGARFFLWHGPVVTIPMQEMRRVLPNPPQIRPDGTTLTPFNIDPIGRTVNRAPVAMTLGEEANRIVEPIRKGWTGGESERHRNTVGAIAACCLMTDDFFGFACDHASILMLCLNMPAVQSQSLKSSHTTRSWMGWANLAVTIW
jgi:hypothetical protein